VSFGKCTVGGRYRVGNPVRAGNFKKKKGSE